MHEAFYESVICVIQIPLQKRDDLKIRIVHVHLNVALFRVSHLCPIFKNRKAFTEVLREVNKPDETSMSDVVFSGFAGFVKFLKIIKSNFCDKNMKKNLEKSPNLNSKALIYFVDESTGNFVYFAIETVERECHQRSIRADFIRLYLIADDAERNVFRI